MNFQDIFVLMSEYPILILCLLLVLGVVFVNGWTDAPNSIATCISTKSIKPKYALIMAAICNLLGVLVAFFFLDAVAYTIQDMVDFSMASPNDALVALSAGMLGVCAWGVLTWYFGIPSSESHSLIGGLTGAGLACMTLNLNVSIPFGPTSSWALTLYGLFGSILFGFFVGLGFTKLIQFIFKFGRFNSDISCEIEVRPLLHISSSFLFVASRLNQPIVFATIQYISVTITLTLSYCHMQTISKMITTDQNGVNPNLFTNCSISFIVLSKFS